MSGYRSRPNVNVSHFLANLNTIPTPEEQVDTFNPDDLALFTNTQFFDFDMGEPLGDFSSSNVSYGRPATTAEPKAEPLQKQHFQEHDVIDSFLGGFDYDYSGMLQPAVSDQHLNHAPSVSTSAAPSISIPLHTGFPHDPAFAAATPSPAPATSSQPATPQTINFPQNTMNGSAATAKRKASVLGSATPESLEEASRLAAEEDKRRRNTAASARFRIKKKQREQALEKSAKEMADKVQQLELKITQLEMENKWLKNLITEKNMGKKEGGMDISEIFNSKFSAAANAPASVSKQEPATTDASSSRN